MAINSKKLVKKEKRRFAGYIGRNTVPMEYAEATTAHGSRTVRNRGKRRPY